MKLDCSKLILAFAVGTSSLILPDFVNAGDFVRSDVLLCGATTEIQDPEFEPGGRRMAFTNKAGELRVTTILSNGRPSDCSGTLIDTGIVIQMSGVPYLNGAE